MIKDKLYYEFRNVKVFYNSINDIINYLEKNNKKPTLLITRLPMFKRDNDFLGRVYNATDLLNTIDIHRQDNLLRRLFDVCRNDCHCYIFTNDNQLKEDMEFMIRAGFIFQNLIVYRISSKKDNYKFFNHNISYIMFFTKEHNYLLNRDTNKFNNLERYNFFDFINTDLSNDYPMKVIDRIIKLSKLEKLDDNLILDLESVKGNVPRKAIEYNMECISLGLDRKINTRLTLYLHKINSINRDIEEKPKKDFTDKNKTIGKSVRKTKLKNKINKLKENLSLDK